MDEVLVLLWLADVVGKATIILTLAAVAALAVAFGNFMDGHKAVKPLLLCVALGVLAAATPSRNTLYVAAAAKAAQTAFQSDLGAAIVEEIKRKLEVTK